MTLTVDGKRLTIAQELKLHADMEHEETQALERMVEPDHEPDPLTRLQELMDTGATQRVLRLTTHEWREMSPSQRKALLDWAVARVKALDEKVAFMSRNLCAGELELPECWRERA